MKDEFKDLETEKEINDEQKSLSEESLEGSALIMKNSHNSNNRYFSTSKSETETSMEF